jgi:hypothetical protein
MTCGLPPCRAWRTIPFESEGGVLPFEEGVMRMLDQMTGLAESAPCGMGVSR